MSQRLIRFLTFSLLLGSFAISAADVPGTTTNEPALNSPCQPFYGIRMSPSGSVENVLDAARCQGAEGSSAITAFLEELKAQLSPGSLLDLEVAGSNLTEGLPSGWLAGVRLRRLSVQQSQLSSVSADAFTGLENVLQELDLSRNRLEEIPSSISNLTALIRLDLSRNKIRHFPQGAVFFRLLKLRHLNLEGNQLGYLDSFIHRQPDGVVVHQHNGSLPMSIFNLEPLRDHVESIQLGGNNLTAFPDQFTRPFGRLRHLDLSSNNFQEIPAEAFAQMPFLRRLNLDDNRLGSLPEFQLPPSLEILSVKGNPLRCDCSAGWLWRWLHYRPTGTGMLSLDDCRDEPWAGRHLSSLPVDFCRSEEAVVVHLVDVDVRPGTDSINVTFHLLDGAVKTATSIKWAISLRRFGSLASPGDSWSGELPVPANTTKEDGLIKILNGLSPSTGYEVCVQLPGTPGSAHCWEVVTQAEAVPPYPVAEVAVAASVSGTSTFILVALVCCYCPRLKRRGGRKKKNNKKKGSNSSGEEKSPIFAISSGSDSPLWVDGPSAEHVRFSTFRTEVVGNEEESRKAFQATCNYLKQRALDPARPAGPLAAAAASGQPGGGQHYFNPLSSAIYFNQAYGMDSGSGGPYKYCTWRPVRVQQHPQVAAAAPPIQRCTSYPDFLASPSLYYHQQGQGGPGTSRSAPAAVALPVYSMTDPAGRRYKRARFYWSAAPAVEFHF